MTYETRKNIWNKNNCVNTVPRHPRENEPMSVAAILWIINHRWFRGVEMLVRAAKKFNQLEAERVRLVLIWCRMEMNEMIACFSSLGAESGPGCPDRMDPNRVSASVCATFLSHTGRAPASLSESPAIFTMNAAIFHLVFVRPAPGSTFGNVFVRASGEAA